MTMFVGGFDNPPIVLIGALLLFMMAIAAAFGSFLYQRQNRAATAAEERDESGWEGYIISAALGLLALLLGFTFALSVDRFETRRELVLQEANAIGTSYLRSQALAEPHRSRMSNILADYTNNRIALALAKPDQQAQYLAMNDRLLADLWAATLAANDTVKSTSFSVLLLTTVNEVIDLDASRKTARRVRVPTEVFVVLWIYIIVTAGILGYARANKQRTGLVALLFVLLTMSFMLILDIDRPMKGGITESQAPMLELRSTLKANPPGSFDRWRNPLPKSGATFPAPAHE